MKLRTNLQLACLSLATFAGIAGCSQLRQLAGGPRNAFTLEQLAQECPSKPALWVGVEMREHLNAANLLPLLKELRSLEPSIEKSLARIEDSSGKSLD